MQVIRRGLRIRRSFVKANACSLLNTSPRNPGTIDTPAFSAIFLEEILSPIKFMESLEGPIKTKPLSSTNLAKEAFSSGDKILSENYLQHADHFERIISHRNLNQNENSSQVASATKEQNNNSSNTSEINQDHITKSKE